MLGWRIVLKSWWPAILHYAEVLHWAPYTQHHTLSTIYWVPYTEHHTLSTIYWAPYTEHHTLSTIHWAPYAENHILSTIHWTPYTEHHTLSTVRWAPYTEHHILSTIHWAPDFRIQFFPPNVYESGTKTYITRVPFHCLKYIKFLITVTNKTAVPTITVHLRINSTKGNCYRSCSHQPISSTILMDL
jgi:hypothetical protein